MDQTSMLITAVGTLAGVITVLAGVMWKIAIWAKSHVVLPLVQSHLDLIDVLKAEMPKQTAALNEHGGKLDAIKQCLESRA